MLKCEIELYIDKENNWCSPCIVVKDEDGRMCPVILPERMDIETGKLFAEKFAKDIEREYQDLRSLKKVLYGDGG